MRNYFDEFPIKMILTDAALLYFPLLQQKSNGPSLRRPAVQSLDLHQSGDGGGPISGQLSVSEAINLVMAVVGSLDSFR